jgi:hypothetical protein
MTQVAVELRHVDESLEARAARRDSRVHGPSFASLGQRVQAQSRGRDIRRVVACAELEISFADECAEALGCERRWKCFSLYRTPGSGRTI